MSQCQIKDCCGKATWEGRFGSVELDDNDWFVLLCRKHWHILNNGSLCVRGNHEFIIHYKDGLDGARKRQDRLWKRMI